MYGGGNSGNPPPAVCWSSAIYTATSGNVTPGTGGAHHQPATSTYASFDPGPSTSSGMHHQAPFQFQFPPYPGVPFDYPQVMRVSQVFLGGEEVPKKPASFDQSSQNNKITLITNKRNSKQIFQIYVDCFKLLL